MRWNRAVAWGLAVVSLTVAAVNLSCGGAPSTEPAAMTPEQKVERGRYLVSVIGCGDCHTPGALSGGADTTRALSGSEMGWVGPWGTAYSANLTPDSTGLQAWTEEQIVTAIRTGNRPDGRQLSPAMPWMTLANLTDEDAGSIAAYLKTIPAVAHRAPAPVPPGQKVAGSLLVFPPPSEWDARHLAGSGGGH